MIIVTIVRRVIEVESNSSSNTPTRMGRRGWQSRIRMSIDADDIPDKF